MHEKALRVREVGWPCRQCGKFIIGIQAYGLHVAEHERMNKARQEWRDMFAQLSLRIDGCHTK